MAAVTEAIGQSSGWAR